MAAACIGQAINQPTSQRDPIESDAAPRRHLGKHWKAAANGENGYLLLSPIQTKTVGSTD